MLNNFAIQILQKKMTKKIDQEYNPKFMLRAIELSEIAYTRLIIETKRLKSLSWLAQTSTF